MTRWFLVLTTAISRGISLFNSSDMDLQQTLPVGNTSFSYLDHEERTVERKKRPPPLDLSSPVLAGAEVIVEPRVPLKCTSQRGSCHLSGIHHDTSEDGDCAESEMGGNVESEMGGNVRNEKDGNMGRQLNGNIMRKDNGNCIANKLESGNDLTHSTILQHPIHKRSQQWSSLQNRSPSFQGPEPFREAAVCQKPDENKSIHVSLAIASDA